MFFLEFPAVALTATIIAISSSMIGIFVVWRKLAYFGDSLSHVSLLGVAAGIVVGAGGRTLILPVCLIFSLALSRLIRLRGIGADSWLTFTSYASIAISFVVLGFSKFQTVDLETFLFGDVLSSQWQDFWLSLGVLLTEILTIGL